MFGFPQTPSPGFSTALAEPDEDLTVVDLHVLACRPADLTTVPAVISAKWAPLREGWISDHCAQCDCEVHVSVSQQIHALASHNPPLVLCMVHAAMLTIRPDVDTSKMVVRRPGA
jgi:hypothetical protein